MSGTAESIRFPQAPYAGELFAAPNQHLYQWVGREWRDVTSVVTPLPGPISEPPDDGALYVRVRRPGQIAAEWVPLPRVNLSDLLPLDGGRQLTRPLVLPGPPTEAQHAVPKAYVDRLCNELRRQLGRLAEMITPKPPDPVGEARGRTYR